MSSPAMAPEPDIGFSVSALPEPHRSRTRQILRQHPEVRGCIGRNPVTFWIIAGTVALQLAMAYLLRASPWWLIVPAAAVVGAFANHALWVLIHECTHNLIFRKPWANTLAGIVANLPHGLPSSVFFQRYHLKHHAFQGIYELDADIPNAWEARLVGTSPVRKAIWLLLFPLVQATRPPRLREIRPIDRWVVANFVAQAAFDVAIWAVLGPRALVYLLVSFFFSVGLHPLGARWIQEHYMIFPGQETTSYYGWLNRLALNVGYHNEHHDFPSVPWNRLPALRSAAPEVYDSLGSHSSWAGLFWRFLFDRRISLFARQLRQNRGGVVLNAEPTPDAELADLPASRSATP
ncbi:MAG: fatty acid desaturase [Thermoanaerobaculia bacterium]